jgi:4-amino-4-deoxy-L-arabinose transferase-like glycosyltransferase
MILKIVRFLSKYKYSIILIAILCLALALRTINLTTNPPALNQDEAVNGYDAFALGTNLKDHHGNFLPIMLQSFGDWVSPVLTYVTVPFVKVFGLSIFTVRIVVALFGVGSIFLFYVFLKQLRINKGLSLLGAFLLAISPWHITMSRWAIPPSILCFFLLLFLCTFIWALRKEKENKTVWQYIIPGVVAAILTSTYPTQKMFAPLFVFVLGIIYLRKNLKNLAVFWLSFVILVSPVFILTLTNPIYNARFSEVSIFSSPNVVKEVGIRYVEYFLPYFHFGASDSNVMHKVPEIGNSYGFLSAFFYLGIIVCILGLFKKISIKNFDNKTYQLLLAWLLLFPLAACLTKSHNMVLRTIHGLPLVVIFFIIFWNFHWSFLKKEFKVIFLSVVFLLGMVNLYQFSKVYFKWYPKMSFLQFQYGIHESLTYLDQNQDKFKKVVIDVNINQPYIYYLFFSKFDPNKLNYSNPWANSSKYTFGQIPNNLTTPPIYTVSFENIKLYDIYAEDNSIWYVKKVN